MELEGAGPLAWPKQFDLRAWGFFLAFDGQRPVGGATIAMHTPGLHMLEGRSELAVLWDLRVHPKRRGRGIGELLFKRSLEWARGRGCRQMKIETQNINVDACRFYARMGCELGAIHRRAYHGSAELAQEAMLLCCYGMSIYENRRISMGQWRIESHPILPIPEREQVQFTWKGRTFQALAGETIASALFANGVRIFGYHPKDGSPQGIFCANGQCAQCTVIADGLPVKACMTLVQPGMSVEPVLGLPLLTRSDPVGGFAPVETYACECLVIGGGPAGLSAAIELGRRGIRTLVIDDKHRLGGKLVLQTHRFFWLHQCLLRRDARHRYRHPSGAGAERVRLRQRLDQQYRCSRLQRPQGGSRARWSRWPR
jgi:hypothetical protein